MDESNLRESKHVISDFIILGIVKCIIYTRKNISETFIKSKNQSQANVSSNFDYVIWPMYPRTRNLNSLRFSLLIHKIRIIVILCSVS